jgi:RimJ/RimL family protein N-acetyltransferase
MDDANNNALHITGQRLNLRDLHFKDLAPAQYWMNPSHEWHKFNGPYYPPTPVDEIPDMMSTWAKHIARNAYPTPRLRLAIIDKSDSIIGTVTRYWISEETNWTAIGIAIWNDEHWGKGYGYEALGLWCDYLFAHEPKFVRLDIRTWSGNHGMIRLAEKLGFQQEAVFRKARIVNDVYYDGLGYGVLREEWQAKYPQGFTL